MSYATLPFGAPRTCLLRHVGRRTVLLLAGMVLLACGGSGGSGEGGKSAPTYAVGGNLAGLANGTVVLSSGVDSVQITVSDGVVKDRPFQIAALPTGAAYNVRIDQQPAGVSCTVLNGANVVGTTPIADIQILCAKRKLLSLVAGPLPAYGTQDGVGTQAGFNFGLARSGISVDQTGNLYVANDTVIRKITPSGIVVTLAGIDGVQGFTDGKGSAARFKGAEGIAVDAAGIVYVADSGNDAVRRVTPDGEVTSVAMNETQKAALKALQPNACIVCGPLGLDGAGNLYLLAGNAPRAVVKVTPAGELSVIAGGLGVLSDFRISDKSVLTTDPAGNVFLSGFRTSLEQVAPDGRVITLVTSKAPCRNCSIDGAADAASFDNVTGLAVGQAGTLWVTENVSSRVEDGFGNVLVTLIERVVRKIDASGTVQTVWRLPITADGALLGSLISSSTGTIFFINGDQNAILKAAAGGTVSTFAGPDEQSGKADRPGSSARFNLRSPVGNLIVERALALLGDGTVVVADSGNRAIRKISPNGTVSSVDVTGDLDNDGGLQVAVNAEQAIHVIVNKSSRRFSTLYRLEGTGALTRIIVGSAGGTDFDGVSGNASASQILRGIVTDSSGELILWTDTCIRRVSAIGTVTTFAGNCPQRFGRPLPVTGSFTQIMSVVPMPDRKYLVLDRQAAANVLKMIDPQSDVETTLRTLPLTNLRLAGDGRGTVLAVTSNGLPATADGIELLSGATFDQSARLADIGARTVPGPLPTGVERPDSFMIGNGRIYLTVRNTVFSVDL